MTVPQRLAHVRDLIESAQRHSLIASDSGDIHERMRHANVAVNAMRSASKELLQIAEEFAHGQEHR